MKTMFFRKQILVTAFFAILIGTFISCKEDIEPDFVKMLAASPWISTHSFTKDEGLGVSEIKYVKGYRFYSNGHYSYSDSTYDAYTSDDGTHYPSAWGSTWKGTYSLQQSGNENLLELYFRDKTPFPLSILGWGDSMKATTKHIIYKLTVDSLVVSNETKPLDRFSASR